MEKLHPVPNLDKFRELILYISQKCANDPSFGAIKVNKILYFSDFLHYANYGTPITGVEYQKLEYGPAPRPLLPIRQKMVNNGELGIQQLPIGSASRQKLVNLRSPDLSLFTAQEIALIDAVIDLLGPGTAADASEMSHRLSGWKLASINETIPYQSVFLSEDLKLTSADMTSGWAVAKEYGLTEPAFA